MEKKSRSIACSFSNEIRQRQIIRGLGLVGIVSLLTTAYLQQTGKIPSLTNSLTTAQTQTQATSQTATPTLTQYVNHDAAAVSQVPKTISKAASVALPAHWSIESNSMAGGFYHAAHKAGLTREEIISLTHILGNQINFRQIHAKDQFKVITERVPATKGGKAVDQILAANFTVDGKSIEVIRYQLSDGRTTYYQPNGDSLEPGFLRYPVHYTRIGSGFSLNRLDPVTHKYHPHPAIDFDAPMGTPIKATGDGRISSMRYETGYGNVVKINHAGHVMTLYAHMRNFAKGLHAGSVVKKGEVIGYVGMTGYTTGPHVHYQLEFNGKPVNPLTAKLPGGSPLPSSQKASFNKLVQQVQHYFG